MNRTNLTRKITYTALFMAIAIILMYFEFVVPFIPPFLKIDLAGAVSMLASLLLGVVPAIIITLGANLFRVPSSTSAGVGEIANFIIISAYLLTGYLIHKYYKGKLRFGISFTSATLIATVVGIFANKYMLIPIYSKTMPIDAIINMANSANPMIDSLDAYLIFGVMPFNLIKFTILSIVTYLLYARLSKLGHFMSVDKSISSKQSIEA